MADKKISDFTAVTSLGTGDLFELETAAGNSRKITKDDLATELGGGGVASGTSFPGSPSDGDRYYRTDRNLEYFYKSSISRWLTTHIISIGYNSLNWISALSASSAEMRLPHPGRQYGYDFFAETFTSASVLTNASTASNYYTVRATTFEATGSVTTQLGSGLSTQSDTQNVWASHSEALDAIVASTVESIHIVLTEVVNASGYFSFTITGRFAG